MIQPACRKPPPSHLHAAGLLSSSSRCHLHPQLPTASRNPLILSSILSPPSKSSHAPHHKSPPPHHTKPPLLSLSPSPNPPRLITPTIPTPAPLMARSLSQTLARLHLPSIPPPRLLAVRSRSDRAANFEPVITEDEDLIGGDAEAIAVRKVEDAIHRVIVKQSQPDWIVFVPGASYWVPPKGRARGLAEVIGGLVPWRTKGNGSGVGGGDNSNKRGDEGLKVVNNRGWPSSDYFFKGVHPSSLDVEMSPKKTSKSEDEEG